MNTVKDVNATKRVNETTHATCYSCKSSNNPALWEEMGMEAYDAMLFPEMTPQDQQRHRLRQLPRSRDDAPGGHQPGPGDRPESPGHGLAHLHTPGDALGGVRQLPCELLLRRG